MNIILNKKYRITTDQHNFILEELVPIDKNHHFAKKTDKTDKWNIIGYYGELEWLFNELIECDLKASEASSLRELVKHTKQLKETLSERIVVSQNKKVKKLLKNL